MCVFVVRQPDQDVRGVIEGLHEYRGLLSCFPDILAVQRVSGRGGGMVAGDGLCEVNKGLHQYCSLLPPPPPGTE